MLRIPARRDGRSVRGRVRVLPVLSAVRGRTDLQVGLIPSEEISVLRQQVYPKALSEPLLKCYVCSLRTLFFWGGGEGGLQFSHSKAGNKAHMFCCVLPRVIFSNPTMIGFTMHSVANFLCDHREYWSHFDSFVWFVSGKHWNMCNEEKG